MNDRQTQPSSYRRIAINTIDTPDPKNGRLSVDPAALESLARSIDANGLWNPITVRMIKDRCTLVAGNRRLAACKSLGHTHIDAHLVYGDEQTTARIRLEENTRRVQLSPVEEAAQIQDYMENCNANEDDLQQVFGRSADWLAGRLEILNWDASLIQSVHEGKISLSAARQLARIPDAESREMATGQAAAHGINTSTARLWLSDAMQASARQKTMTEFRVNSSVTPPSTETRYSCFACKGMVKVEATASVRLCTDCCQALSQAQFDSATPSPNSTDSSTTPLEPTTQPH